MGESLLTLASLPSPPWPPKTRFGLVKLSGLGPPEMGVGIGEGECAGEAMRGFCAWMPRLPCTAGEAWAGAGELVIDPNLMPEGGPVVGGVCLMCTEDLRLWSPLGPPLTMAGMVGMAGLMEVLPFTGDTEELFPCCALCGPPTAAGGAPLDAIVGEEVFWVALAWELRAVGWADPAATLADDPEEELFAAVAVEEAAMVGVCAFEMDALIRRRGGGVWWGESARASWARWGEVRCVAVRTVACAVARFALVTSLISDRREVQLSAY